MLDFWKSFEGLLIPPPTHPLKKDETLEEREKQRKQELIW